MSTSECYNRRENTIRCIQIFMHNNKFNLYQKHKKVMNRVKLFSLAVLLTISLMRTQISVRWFSFLGSSDQQMNRKRVCACVYACVPVFVFMLGGHLVCIIIVKFYLIQLIINMIRLADIFYSWIKYLHLPKNFQIKFWAVFNYQVAKPEIMNPQNEELFFCKSSKPIFG